MDEMPSEKRAQIFEHPDWHEFDAIIAMGGPMSATDDAELPWLVDEKALPTGVRALAHLAVDYLSSPAR